MNNPRTQISPKELLNIAAAIIANQLAADCLEQVKHTTLYRGIVKRHVNLCNKSLLTIAKDFEDFISSGAEKNTDELYNMNFDMVQELVQIGFTNADEVVEVLQAFQKNKDKVIGNARRINKTQAND